MDAPPVITIRNGTARVGLAHSIARSLAHDGFTVTVVGNRRALAGPSLVRYPPDRFVVAQRLAAWIPGARLQPAPGLTAVELDVASGFSRLSRATEARGALARLATPSPAPGPGCGGS